MSKIYMDKKEIFFNTFQPDEYTINKMVTQSNFYFPSNIIGCGISLSQTSFHYLNMKPRINHSVSSTDGGVTTSDSSELIAVTYGPVEYFGVGINNITVVGTAVNFTAWMQLFSHSGYETEYSTLNPRSSYFTAHIIAECE